MTDGPSRLPRRRRRQASPPPAGLAFKLLPGVVVAVCGLAGGAATTTLAYRLARQAARESGHPVLICDSESSVGGLAAVTGRSAARGLGGSADLAGEAPPAPVDLCAGLRLLAARPRPTPVVCDEALAAVIGHLRECHPLVVIDCRTLDHPHALPLIALASHVVWTTPLSADAVAAASLTVACGNMPAPGGAREALVATRVRPHAHAAVSELRALAGCRHEMLVVVPYVRALAAHGADAGELEEMSAALTQLATFLRRTV